MSDNLKVMSVRLGSATDWALADCFVEVDVLLGGDRYHYNAYGTGDTRANALADAVKQLPKDIPDGLKAVVIDQLSALMVEGVSE